MDDSSWAGAIELTHKLSMNKPEDGARQGRDGKMGQIKKMDDSKSWDTLGSAP